MRPAAVRAIAKRIEGLSFEDVYGYTWGRNIIGGARTAVDASLGRYLNAIAA
jgi:hypothetical protein